MYLQGLSRTAVVFKVESGGFPFIFFFFLMENNKRYVLTAIECKADEISLTINQGKTKYMLFRKRKMCRIGHQITANNCNSKLVSLGSDITNKNGASLVIKRRITLSKRKWPQWLIQQQRPLTCYKTLWNSSRDAVKLIRLFWKNKKIKIPRNDSVKLNSTKMMSAFVLDVLFEWMRMIQRSLFSMQWSVNPGEENKLTCIGRTN